MKLELLERIKKLREELNSPDITEDQIRAYCIQLETLLPQPTKTLYMDTDGLIFQAAYSPGNISSIAPILGGTFVGTPVNTDNISIDLFELIVTGVVESCKLESLKGNMIRFKDYKLVFTPRKNFRYDLFPEYKIKRKDRVRSKEELQLKEYVKDFGIFVEGVEADDVVAYFGRRGHPIASGDKDVIFGVPGLGNYHYHASHKKPYKVSEEEANRFLLIQCIMGDSADDIPGIEGIGIKTAEKLLGDNETFERVIEIYEGKNIGDVPTAARNKLIKALEVKTYTREDAILTRRLVGLDQWKGFRRNKIILFGTKESL